VLQIAVVPVTEYQQNCSIVYDDQTKNAVVVDPGGEVEKIAAAVEELGVKVEAVWLTHGHLDHAGGAEAAKAQFGVQIIGPHQDDKMLLDNIEMISAGYGLSGMFNASPDQWLEEGDSLSVGEYEFEVRHCPGHAPGHVVWVRICVSLTLTARARPGHPYPQFASRCRKKGTQKMRKRPRTCLRSSNQAESTALI
jgi:glyoxylase-like metal-dependent hydrolase (beta-lactamase superfamily II)